MQRHWNYAAGWRETHRPALANNDTNNCANSYDAAAAPGFGADAIRRALAAGDDIH